MAASLTVTMSNPFANKGKNDITLDWVSAADGSCSKAILSTSNSANDLLFATHARPSRIAGKLASIETIPGLSGDKTTLCPTDNYDITITDQYGYDIAVAELADRSTSVAQQIVPSVPIPVDTTELTLNITHAGDSKKGRVIIRMVE